MKATMTKPISPRQLQALQTAIQGIGIRERQERLEWLSGQTGRAHRQHQGTDLRGSEAPAVKSER